MSQHDRSILCIGGPADGQRIELHESEEFMSVPAVPISAIQGSVLNAIKDHKIEMVLYQRRTLFTSSSGTDVMIPSGSNLGDAVRLLVQKYPSKT